MRLLFTSLTAAALIAWLYVMVATRRPSAEEARRLKEGGYSLGAIAQFLFTETQTKRDIYADQRARRRFFRIVLKEFAGDAWRMLKTERFGFWSVWLHAVFWSAWVTLWLKSWIYCGYLDIFFMSGLNLTLYRSAQQHGV